LEPPLLPGKGNRHYELTNHLGNVLAVITDRKIAKDLTADATYTPQFYMPDVYSVQNYYAFGQPMPGWSGTATVNDPKKYRFGYNGKEDDDEWAKQDYGFRISDPRIGRFLSVDPISNQYPELTPYQFAGNMPIWASDLDGLEPNKETGQIQADVVFHKVIILR
jgi:RHS repeat-associated protein